MTSTGPKSTAETSSSDQQLLTSCPLDCPDACSLVATVEDGRIAQLDGDHRNPLTDGFICSKVRRFPQHVYGADRLRSPLLRTGAKGEGTFKQISWDEALDRIVTEIRRVQASSGSEAILPVSYGGSNGLLSQDTTDARLFYRLQTSKLARVVCAAPSTAAANALVGGLPGTALEDIAQAQLIVVWGANPSTTGIHLVPVIQQAQRRGAKLVVVDPVTTQLAKRADLHIAPRPGTDLPIALAMIHEMVRRGAQDADFLAAHTTGSDELIEKASSWTLERASEVSGIAADVLRDFLDLYLATSPAVIRCGWGVERNRNGCSAVAAILALPAIAGKFGVRGGGYTMSNSGFLRTSSVAQAPEPPTRTVNMNLLGRALLEYSGPGIDFLFVYNCNPLATLPNQELVLKGLQRDDLFTVVFDQVMTDTAKFGDIVLPATTFLEHRDTRKSYGALVAQRVEPVIEPVGESRSNLDVFAELIRRLGLEEEGDLLTPDEVEEALFKEETEMHAELTQTGLTRVDPLPVQFLDSFPATPDRKMHLFPAELASELYTYRDETELTPAGTHYPLALISPATRSTVSSTFGQLVEKQTALLINPVDASARGLSNGDTVRAYNQYGEVVCQLRVTDDVATSVVVLPKGIWMKHTHNERTSNALSPDTLEPLSGGACFNDARVEVESASES